MENGIYRKIQKHKLIREAPICAILGSAHPQDAWRARCLREERIWMTSRKCSTKRATKGLP